MNKLLPMGKLAVLSGLGISIVSAWYSISGLAVLFAGAFWAVIVMGIMLEIGKLVAASWVYRNWKLVPILLKGYFVTAIVVLMIISAIGIFGFLSKAHLSQQTESTLASSELATFDIQISQHQQTIKISQAALDRLDKISNSYANAASDVKSLDKANAVQMMQGKERKKALAAIAESQKEIQRLTIARMPSATIATNVAAEIGPIKYVAELLYGESGQETLDKSVRMLILAIVFVFDPLAVLLIVAGNTPRPTRDSKGRFLPSSAVWTDGKHWKPKA